MTGEPTVLVAIRYPLNDEGSRTLAAAERLANNLTQPTLTVLHVNLYQNRYHTSRREFANSISSILTDVEASATIRHGFLVEQEILAEATEIGADIIVIGANQQSIWQRVLHRLFRTEIKICSFLFENTAGETEIVEVDTTFETAIGKSA